jgi:pyrimidine-nucleoside phosphorylase
MDGSATRNSSRWWQAQGGNPQALDRFELLPNATGMREIFRRAPAFVSAIMAEDIGRASHDDGRGPRAARKTRSIPRSA